MSWSRADQRRRSRSSVGQIELLGDEVGQGTDPFAMTAGEPIVGVERPGQSENPLGGHDGLVFDSSYPRLLHAPTRSRVLPERRATAKRLGARSGKTMVIFEEDGEGQGSTGQPIDQHQDDGWERSGR